MADNIPSILDKIARIGHDITEYQRYIECPMDKIVSDIKTFLKEYSSDEKKSSHISEQESPEILIEVGNKQTSYSRDMQYLVFTRDNQVSTVFGADLLNIDLESKIILPLEYSYYFLYDRKGCCTMTRELLTSVGSRFKSDALVGVIGLNDLGEITIKQGNGKVYEGVSWSLRQKSAYIRLSKEEEPDFEILKIPSNN